MNIWEELYAPYMKIKRHWSMVHAERAAMIHLLQMIKPQISIEVGSESGGSTAVIAHLSKQVYALDVDPTVEENVKEHPNIEFIGGFSQDTLPGLLERLVDQPLNFILIDGDHSTEAVMQDCENVLAFCPTAPLYILMHDSFYPSCRKGILAVDWQKNPYVHYVEVDFVQGIFSAFPGIQGQLAGGLALIVMYPEERQDPLHIQQQHRKMYEACLRQSSEFRHVKGLYKIPVLARKVLHKLTRPTGR